MFVSFRRPLPALTNLDPEAQFAKRFFNSIRHRNLHHIYLRQVTCGSPFLLRRVVGVGTLEMTLRRGILLLFFIALVGLALYFLIRPPPQTLRRGEGIVLADITYGLKHSCRWGSGRFGKLWQLLPPVIRFRVAAPMVASFTTPTNTVTIWFRINAPAAASGPGWNLGSAYECTLVDVHGKEAAADSLNLGMATGIYGDRRRLCYATFPWVTGSFRLRIQQRVVNEDGSIRFTKPRPPNAGLSGARLHPETVEFKLDL